MIAVVSLILGVVALVAGVGQRTFWAPPETLTATLAAPADAAPVTVIDPAVYGIHPDKVDIHVEAEGSFFLAVGRTDDVQAWVGPAAHNNVTGIEETSLVSEFTPGEATVPNPDGSDLWVTSEAAEGELTYRWIDPAPGDWSMLLASDGTAAAPTEVSVTWPNDRSTPWAVPLTIIGALLLVFGLALLFVARRPGKRRPGSPVPAAAGGSPRGNGPRATRSAQRGRPRTGVKRDTRSFLLFPGAARLAPAAARIFPAAALAAALVVPAGLGVQAASASPAPAPVPAESADAGPPVLLEGQLKRIVESVAASTQAADAAKDEAQLDPRVGGAARELRAVNYKVSAQVPDIAVPTAIAQSPIVTRLVSTSRGWPRTVVAVTQTDAAAAPQALVLSQKSARENYQLVSAVQMLPSTVFPTPSTEPDGTPTIAADDAQALIMPPKDALSGLAGYLTNAESDFAPRFEASVFADKIHEFQRVEVESNQFANITFNRAPDEAQTSALRTADGGALVSGYFRTTMTSVPKEAGGTVNLTAKDIAALAGDSSTTSGVDVTYGESVLLYVPPAGSDAKTELIAASQNIVGAKLK